MICIAKYRLIMALKARTLHHLKRFNTLAMTPAPQKRGKTETLSLRLDPKTKFALDFIVRIKGQSITTVVERALKEAASDVRLDGNSESQSWSNFWDPSEGVRALNLISNEHYPTTYEEDELREFTKTHWEFFYSSEKCVLPRRSYVDVLWNSIDVYLETWINKKSTDYWAAGNLMKKALADADLASPAWPRVIPKKAPKEAYDLNDDIPF